MIALTAGFVLTARRVAQIVLVIVASALVGLIADRWPRTARGFSPTLAIAAGIVSPVFLSVLSRAGREWLSPPPRSGCSGGSRPGVSRLLTVCAWALRPRPGWSRRGRSAFGSIGFLQAGISIAAPPARCSGADRVRAQHRCRIHRHAADRRGRRAVRVGAVLLADSGGIASAVSLDSRRRGAPRRRTRRASCARPFSFYAAIAAAVPILAAWYAARGKLG